MRRFEFRLEPVLRHKRRHEQAAELRLALAAAAEQAARSRVDELRLQLDRLAQEMSAGRTDSAGAWLARFERSDRLGAALRAAESVLAESVRAHEEAGRLRVRAGIEVEALQTLRTQQWEAHRREEQRHEQARLDETGLRGWVPPGRPDGD
jgi:flagellar FliJ protein